MTQWWEIDIPEQPGAMPKLRAVAYYRHSAQDRQENSIPIQRDQVREWADKNGVEIIQEFSDAGKSGLTSEGRPAFTELMDQWVKQRTDFTYILCLDVSRWGRFQDIDLSAQFSAECKKHGKQVIYTTIGKPTCSRSWRTLLARSRTAWILPGRSSGWPTKAGPLSSWPASPARPNSTSGSTFGSWNRAKSV